ncbi:MAG: thioredoxin-disulfide reductase [Candidatus Omnitrophota bacterium]
MADYDVVIIGGGPAGLTAGIYTARARLKTLLLERLFPGGQILTSPLVENYPGFARGVTGEAIVNEMVKQATRLGLEIKTETAISIEDHGQDGKVVKTNSGSYKALAIILTMGADPSKLNVPGEEKLEGKGVSHCATCDAPLFRDKEVIVVGGGDTAVEDAIFLTTFCRRVKVVHRRDQLRATKILQERAFQNKKINFIWNTVVAEILGQDKVEKVKLKNVKTGEEAIAPTDGVFVGVGLSPNTDIVKGLVEMDEKNYILTSDDMVTSREGIFAAGDCKKRSFHQMINACGEGATAAYSAQKYIENISS